VSQRRIALVGSTGSIGRSALRVIARHPEAFRVVALAALNSVDELREQAARVGASYVGVVAPGGPIPEEWRSGSGVPVEAATLPDVDIVLNAVVGAAGLGATLAALDAGKRVALANKESLVVGGELVAAAAARGGGEVVPVDSEHSAILQCIGARPQSEIRRLILTASGGPFRAWPAERIGVASVEDALRHPTWRMGRKITVDSATLANKALEVIEAHFLFGLSYDAIEVVVHPQSIIHSMVEFIDGSVVAQLGVPSMELPILYALTHPDRLEDRGVPMFDPIAASPLTFEPVREEAFPTLQLGIAAGRRGGAAPAVFNASNEQAVALFLEGTIGFADIPRVIASALDSLGDLPGGDRESLLAADLAARHHVSGLAVC
jgi:1-deoxy-D-xylulose-5-phosphate reductoisomerase